MNTYINKYMSMEWNDEGEMSVALDYELLAAFEARYQAYRAYMNEVWC